METTVLTPAEKARYIRSIILDIFFIGVIVAFIMFYVTPKYEVIYANIDKSQGYISQLDTYTNVGVDAATYNAFAKKYNPGSTKIGVTDAVLTESLKKPADFNGNYIEWVSAEVSSGASNKYDETNEKNSQVIGNIIPTFTEGVLPGDMTSIDANRITLAGFVKFVEENLLKRYAIDSTSSIGITNVTFSSASGSNTTVANNSIGSFSLPIEFSAKNSKISEFIRAIQQSGTFAIKDDLLIPPVAPSSTEGGVSSLNNLLITIDSLKLKAPVEANDEINGGSIQLRFYVKGRDYGSYLQIRSFIADAFKEFRGNLSKNVDRCKQGSTDVVCKMDAGVTIASHITNISRDFAQLEQRFAELQKNTNATDFSKDLPTYFALYSSYKALQDQFTSDIQELTKLSAASK